MKHHAGLNLSIGIGVLISLYSLHGVLAEDSKEATALVRQAIDEKVNTIKNRLRADYDAHDKGLLLKNKENVDSFFLPIFLLYEMADSRPLDLCRLLRFDYQNTQYRLEEHLRGEDETRLRQGLSGLALPEGTQVQFSLCMRRYPTIGADYPVVLFVAGHLCRSGGTMYGLSYEPYLANRDIAFPVHPEHLRFRWTGRPATTEPNHTGKDADVESTRPLFNNPPGLYALSDSMQLLPHLLNMDGLRVCDSRPQERRATNDGIRIELSDLKGRHVRTTRVRWDRGEPCLIQISQDPIEVLHFSPENYQIRRALGSQVIGTEAFQPSSVLTYLPDGRTIDIRLEPSPHRSPEEMVLPKEITVCRRGQRIFSARFLQIRYERGLSPLDEPSPVTPEAQEVKERQHQVYAAIDTRNPEWQPRYYASTELAEAENLAIPILKARLKYNIYAAVKVQDFPMVHDMLNLYRRVLLDEEVEYDMYVFSVEALTQMSFEFIDDQTGWMMADTFLRDAYEHCSGEELMGHVVRLASQYRLGYALLALRASRDKMAGPEDVRLLPQLKTLEAMIRPMAAGCEGKYRKPDYVYLPSYEKVNASIERQLPNPLIP